MNPKEQITKIKEYADIADASYAMLQYVDENEITTQQINEENEKKQRRAKYFLQDGFMLMGLRGGMNSKRITKRFLENKDNPQLML